MAPFGQSQANSYGIWSVSAAEPTLEIN